MQKSAPYGSIYGESVITESFYIDVQRDLKEKKVEKNPICVSERMGSPGQGLKKVRIWLIGTEDQSECHSDSRHHWHWDLGVVNSIKPRKPTKLGR